MTQARARRWVAKRGRGRGRAGSVRYRVDPKNASVVDNILNDKLSPTKQKDC